MLVKYWLSVSDDEPVHREKIKLPPRQERSYVRPPEESQNFVPSRYEVG